jgi:TetR/AcrR family transcriptional regulator, transcriptional repressor for nem operon
MRHANQTKAESHRRIVSQASKMMRERGSGHVSVSDVMKASGLTHGGFYAHFASKDALAAAAVEEGFRDKIDFLNGPDADALQQYVESFLCEGHLQNLEVGCPIIGFAPDAVRSSELYKDAVSEGIGRLVEALSKRLDGTERPSDNAIRLLAVMVGGVVMARAVKSSVVQDRILNAVRTSAEVLQQAK